MRENVEKRHVDLADSFDELMHKSTETLQDWKELLPLQQNIIQRLSEEYHYGPSYIQRILKERATRYILSTPHQRQSG